jgi:hypothetical protein
VIGELLWKPFNDRFGDFVQRFRNHRDLIYSEIALVQIRMTQTVETVMRQERVENTKARQAIERLQQLFSSNEKLRIEDLKGRSTAYYL